MADRMSGSPAAYVRIVDDTEGGAPAPEDGVERTLRLLRGLAEQGLMALNVEIGDTVKVHGLSLLPVEGDTKAEPSPGSRSYVGRALEARKVG